MEKLEVYFLLLVSLFIIAEFVLKWSFTKFMVNERAQKVKLLSEQNRNILGLKFLNGMGQNRQK